jgi:hypothetical protein
LRVLHSKPYQLGWISRRTAASRSTPLCDLASKPVHCHRRHVASCALEASPCSRAALDVLYRGRTFIKPAVRDPQRVLHYLGRYVHRTALTDKAIVGCDDKTVSFAYRDSRDQQRKCMTLPAHEFVRRFLQHVPPKGLHRVRVFGLLHAAHRITLKRVQLLTAAHAPTPVPAVLDSGLQRSPLRCPHCLHATLRLLRRLSPSECVMLVRAAMGFADNAARAPPHSLTASISV